jgi:hypothetical protein
LLSAVRSDSTSPRSCTSVRQAEASNGARSASGRSAAARKTSAPDSGWRLP